MDGRFPQSDPYETQPARSFQLSKPHRRNNQVPTGVIDPDIHLPPKRLLDIIDDLVHLVARVDVTLERLDLDTVLGADRLGEGGGVGRGVCYGDIRTGCSSDDDTLSTQEEARIESDESTGKR